MSLLALNNLGYKYAGENKQVLKNISFNFDNGKIYAIVGKSGAGKTTLLSLLSGLDNATEGEILFNGKDIKKIDKYKYRSENVGVVFQSFNLLYQLTAVENVMLSMDISGKKYKNKKEKAYDFLKKVGLSNDEANRKILKLSGGQQQRVAIARAISYNPSVILADEPTGNLDAETQQEILKIFRMLADEGKCVIIVTHSKEVSDFSDIKYEILKQ